MGSNGAGKTTLMKVLLRLLQPQKGEVRLGGRNIAALRPAELYRRVGMVFQNPADQLFAASVEEDVAFGPRNLGLPEAEVAERVDEALAAADAAALRSRPIHHLSFGEQKRACLAGVLAMRPAVLVLDEPIAGLDPVSESHMIELLLRLNRQQRITMILSTHSVDLLPVLAHRICVLAKGRMQQEGPPEEILSDPRAIDRAGLRLPLISQLFHELGVRDGLVADPLPLSIDHARRRILGWIAEGVLAAREPGRRGMSLRPGITTGVCAAAAAKAAAIALGGGPLPAEVEITLPSGQTIGVPILNVRLAREAAAATASVRKDAGDDPDVTNGLEVRVTVSWNERWRSELCGRRGRGHRDQAGAASSAGPAGHQSGPAPHDRRGRPAGHLAGVAHGDRHSGRERGSRPDVQSAVGHRGRAFDPRHDGHRSPLLQPSPSATP